MIMSTFESLPVELIADILSELDLETLIKLSRLSRRLRSITSDSSLNPWRRPILRNLRSGSYEQCLKHLCVRSVPRQNWVEILSIARPAFLLFESTLPNLKSADWEESFKRRFLPGWHKWKKEGEWKEAFLKVLYRVWHRSQVTCTADEAWNKYIVLNRNGSANELESPSRNFNPLSLFNEMKLQSNLSHLETRIRLVVEFADVRIIALGTLNKPRSPFYVNFNAHSFFNPPGIEANVATNMQLSGHKNENARLQNGEYDTSNTIPSPRSTIHFKSYHVRSSTYQLTHPLPSPSHANYPFYTPGGGDKRWLDSGDVEEESLQWVGGLMIIAQLLGPHIHDPSGLEWPHLQDLDLVLGPGRNQYASFSWPDLAAIAPWMEEKITKKINGPGLGN